MIVVNKKPNITHMPYKLDKRRGTFSFVPGQNNIDAEVWRAVLEEAGEKRWGAHYSRFLKPIGGDAAEEEIDPASLNADDFIDLIQGAMSLEQLEVYVEAEEGHRGGPRKTVMAAIAEQAEKIKEIEDKKQENEQ